MTTYTKPKVNWINEVDWNKHDALIAKELNISRERVRQVRKSMGLLSSKYIKKGRKLKVDPENINWNLRDTTLAKSNDVCPHTIAKLRHSFAPQTKFCNSKIRIVLKEVNWSLKQKEIQQILKEKGIITSQTNISRYKKIFAPHLMQNRVTVNNG